MANEAGAPDEKTLYLMIGTQEADLLEAIPELEHGHVSDYVRAVNKAMLLGALDPGRGKIMLYGAQLFLSTNQVEGAKQQRTAELSQEAGTTIHRATPDRRFRTKEAE